LLLLQDAKGIGSLPRKTPRDPAFAPIDGRGELWPGAGIAGRSHVFLVASRVRLYSSVLFSYKLTGSEMLVLDPTTFRVVGQRDLPRPQGIGWGSAIHTSGRYAYIYGIAGGNGRLRVYLARSRADDLRSRWSYFTGSRWSGRARDARHLGLEGFNTSFSVFTHRGRLFVLNEEPGFSRPVYLRAATRPEGPFGRAKMVYVPPVRGPRYAYNAVVHPQIAGPGVVFGYSVNSSDDADLFANLDALLPGFARIPENCFAKVAKPPES
ncbi:MAG: hypothetical protein H0T15_06620, partial [Thermoleophilaceae bacterium]|nr:hypothetical protein [Thermoleophilaceae bacterium]